jgi:hypothetical protein
VNAIHILVALLMMVGAFAVGHIVGTLTERGLWMALIKKGVIPNPYLDGD